MVPIVCEADAMPKLVFLKSFQEFDIWEFTPGILHAFPFYLEPITWSWRIRCIQEFFVGYKVYYIRIRDKWAGYCVVSSGRNRRYLFSDEKDIIYGRFFIAKEFRGKKLALKMLLHILNDCGLKYKKAFAYLHNSNIASKKTMISLGAKELYRFDIKGLFRNHFIKNNNGDFVLFEYNPERNDNGSPPLRNTGISRPVEN